MKESKEKIMKNLKYWYLGLITGVLGLFVAGYILGAVSIAIGITVYNSAKNPDVKGMKDLSKYRKAAIGSVMLGALDIILVAIATSS